MRVVFINIADVKGGASIVTNRLRLFMVKHYDIDAYYVVAYKELDDDRVFATRGKIGWFIERLLDLTMNKLGLQYLFFPVSSRFMIRKVRMLKPDVISLQNTHGGYFQTNIIRSLSRLAPVVWTLHDMWAFTGNAAHTFGNESWKAMGNDEELTKIHPRIGLNTGSWLLRRKERIYRESDIVLVTPSQWLLDLARQSPVFAGKELIHIFNGIDLGVFRPGNKAPVRSALAITGSSKVIMFSAGALVDNMWKGGDHLLKVLDHINGLISEPIHLVVVGSGELRELDKLSRFVVHRIGYVQSEREMADYYSASDVFIYPTKADTLPTVLIEASACGTPCVTFDIGGSREIVIDGVTGVVVKPFELDQMAVAIVDLLSDQSKRMTLGNRARIHMEANFSIEIMSRKYWNIFQGVVERRHSGVNNKL